MLVFSVIMFASAILILVPGIKIFRGKTNLIHDYHQKNITEKTVKKYGKTFGAGMLVLSVSLFACALLALFDLTAFSMAALFCGIAVFLAIIIYAQKKYNGGIF